MRQAASWCLPQPPHCPLSLCRPQGKSGCCRTCPESAAASSRLDLQRDAGLSGVQSLSSSPAQGHWDTCLISTLLWSLKSPALLSVEIIACSVSTVQRILCWLALSVCDEARHFAVHLSGWTGYPVAWSAATRPRDHISMASLNEIIFKKWHDAMPYCFTERAEELILCLLLVLIDSESAHLLEQHYK